jgi:hypothetical protein
MDGGRESDVRKWCGGLTIIATREIWTHQWQVVTGMVPSATGRFRSRKGEFAPILKTKASHEKNLWPIVAAAYSQEHGAILRVFAWNRPRGRPSFS